MNPSGEHKFTMSLDLDEDLSNKILLSQWPIAANIETSWEILGKLLHIKY